MSKELESAAQPSTLGEALPMEMARVRDDLLPLYDSIPTGFIAAKLMRIALDRAAVALAEGDIAEMIRAYEDLKGFTE